MRRQARSEREGRHRPGRRRRRVQRRLLTLVLAGSLFSLASQTAAQDGDDALGATRTPAMDLDRATQDLEALTRARQALQEAPETPVSFADILKNPDDIALNFAYARQQVAQGRLKAAATTLERILLIQPNLHEIRLFYALVLIRLDSLQSATRELDRLAALDMTPALRGELEALRAQIAQRRQRLSATLLVGAGGAYDWNVNSVPASRIMSFGGVSAWLDDQSDRVGDFSYTGFSRLEAAYDLGFQARHEVIGSATAYLDEQVNYSPQDVGSFSMDAGLRIRLPDLTLTPRAFYTDLRLSHQHFLRSYGVSLDARYMLPPDTAILGGLKHSKETFFKIRENTTAVEDDGRRLEGHAGVEIDLDARNQVLLRYDIHAKYGRFRAKHRWGHSVTGRYTRLFDGGVFATGTLELAGRQNLIPDPAIDPNRTRQDGTIRAGLRVGAPVMLLAGLADRSGRLARLIGPAVATLSVEGYRSTSNIRNYQYWNRRASVLVTRRWRF